VTTPFVQTPPPPAPFRRLLLSGVIPIAHNSGGPRADIVVDYESDEGPQRTGYLAETKQEYCSAIKTVRRVESCADEASCCCFGCTQECFFLQNLSLRLVCISLARKGAAAQTLCTALAGGTCLLLHRAAVPARAPPSCSGRVGSSGNTHLPPADCCLHTCCCRCLRWTSGIA
jgi:hypothetical protein